MNVNYFKTLWKSSLMVLFLCLGLSSWGQTTVTSNFGAQSGNIGDDNTITYSSEQTNPLYWSPLRVYANTVFSVQSNNDAIITSLSITYNNGDYYNVENTYNIGESSSSTSEVPSENISGSAPTRVFTFDVDDNVKYFYFKTTAQVRLNSITVTYEIPATGDHTITVTQPTGGEITPGTTGVDDGESASFTATPESSCYTFSHWIVDGENAGNTNPYVFTNVTGDHTISAVFEAVAPYTITATAGANGSISPNGATSVNCGADQIFTITPNSGYAVADVLVNGVSVGAVTTYTFENVTEDQAISASFVEFTGPCVEEDFSGIANSSSYGTKTWTGTGGTWTATDAREDQTINGKAITIRNGVLTSPEFTNGVSSITMTTKLPFQDQAGNLVVKVNDIEVGTIPYSSEITTSTISNVNIGGNVIVTVHSSGARVTIDDLEWTCYSSTSPTLTVDPTAITDLNYGEGNGPSASQSFVLSGENLDGSEDVTLVAGTGFEISFNNADFEDELTLTAYEGENTTIYVRLASGLASGAHSDIILIYGYGIEQEITVSGNVLGVPVITEADDLTAQVGVAYSYQIIASDEPFSYVISSEALPAGLSLNTETGFISGTPTVAGEFIFGVKATNNIGTSEEGVFILTVAKGVQTVDGLGNIDAYLGDADMTLPATTDQGFTLVYDMDLNDVATISGNTLSITGIGTVEFMAYTEDGDANYEDYLEIFTITVTEAPVIPKVIISQVYEGASNNKWIELANVGDTTIDLSQVKIAIWSKNGDSGLGEISGDPTNSTILSGTLSSGATFLIRHGSASTNIPHNPMPEADLSGIAQASFNGDDALALMDLDNNIIDAFGHGINNKDKSYHRKSEVSSPNATFTLSEWEERTLDDIAAADDTMTEYIGTHIYGGLTVWTINNEWLDGIVPTITDDAIIEGDLTLTENLYAKTLTVAAGGKITVPANKVLTVDGAIINEAGAANFVVENDGILIQNTDAENTGAITVKRNSNPMFRLDYTLWSSPVAGMRLVGFSNVSPTSPAAGNGTLWTRVYTLGETAWEQVWNSQPDFENDTLTFTAAKGYLYRAPNDWVVRNNPEDKPADAYPGVFTGVPNNGEYSINTPNTFDAVGNPYPSPIYADDFITSNSVDAIYFWTNVNSSNGVAYTHNNWASYTTLGGVGVTIGDSGIIDPNSTPADNMHIQPGQGFVVYTEENSVSFNNAMRINSNGQFFRQMSNEKHRFWLNLSNEEVVFNQILVGYMDNATQGVDTGIDGKMFAYEGNALYSIIDNNEDMFVIQGRSLPFTASDVVALGFRAVNAGSFTISLANLDGLFAEGNTTIYLKDNFTQTQHNLNSGAYSFVSEEGIFNTRFEVVYQTTMSVENPIANNANWIVYSQENGYQIQTQGFELKSVQVFDLLGRAIYTASAEGTAHHIPSLGADSVYIVKVTTTDNVVLSKKVR